MSIHPQKPKSKVDKIDYFAKNRPIQDQSEVDLVKITNSLNLAQEIAKLGSWDYDVENNTIYCSDPLYSILGIEKDGDIQPLYENLLAMILPEDRESFDYLFQQTKKLGTEMDIEYKIQKFDGSIITAHVRAVGKKGPNGQVTRIIGILHDISDRILTENRLKESEEKIRNITTNIDIGIWSMDYQTKKVTFASPAIEKISGYPAEDFLSGKVKWKALIHPEDKGKFSNQQKDLLRGKMYNHNYRIIDRNGQVKWIENKTIPILNAEGQLIRLDGIVQDISIRKKNEERINYFAYHDYLTELPNRRMFDEQLEQMIVTKKGTNEKFALFYLDMDRFKFVNDTLGHDIGDLLLGKVAKRLSAIAGEHTVFRVGGDEFTIIQDRILEKDPVKLGEELICKMEEPFQIEGYEIHMTTSIGISIFPEDGNSIKRLIMNADVALYRAKELGKNNVQLFTKSLIAESYKLFTLESDLRKAIQRKEFILHYQPRVDALTGEIVGAEALSRWNHTRLGLVPPCEFIPLAEETGFIHELSEWVIQEVCKQQKEWREEGCTLVPISINLSAKTLMKADLVQKVKACLDEYSVPAQLLEIEITEDSLIKNEGLGLSTIKHLRKLGLAIAIDDFGIGYSSLSYLKKFTVDYIKIDRSFIREIHLNDGDSTIVQSIILLAKGFHLKIVAEGVETVEQWELLKSLNCHYIQGFLFSKPLPAKQLTNLLQLNKINIQP
ncbi:bifunctional diguanylate cyclase/phosphodiesterase [Neobacillus niacini]|uniref:bifunctional diguanylate cyclase/phosphodiesterase n=1 Tax=Neobacillus niacini TaxID=86668 RepID=UPI00203E8BCF|nr:GGDEF domain-containing phosphodiesterase [Neobacillus niacini]MCM3691907.1 EAL domain-containing protein [Neobacillus niacini]